MITKDQQKWLDHLNDDEIGVKPYDPKSPKIFQEIKEKIIRKIGKVAIFHRGASYLKISGQDEIDIYIPVKPNNFDIYVDKMSKAFSEPASLYPLERARFKIQDPQKRIDIFVINKDGKSWIECEIFTKYLKKHKKVLKEYEALKEANAGLSTKKYYTRKIEFFSKVLDMAKKSSSKASK